MILHEEIDNDGISMSDGDMITKSSSVTCIVIENEFTGDDTDHMNEKNHLVNNDDHSFIDNGNVSTSESSE